MRHVLAAVLCKSNNCRPEAAESRAQASDSQRRISIAHRFGQTPINRGSGVVFGQRRAGKQKNLAAPTQAFVNPRVGVQGIDANLAY